MKISLIVCTYMRPESIGALMESVGKQTRYPDEILVIDGSIDELTESLLSRKRIQNLHYHRVLPEDRGLTRQRNYGIKKVDPTIDIIAFLDDDTILSDKYFEVLEKTFSVHRDAVGVGGVATNENRWLLKEQDKFYDKNYHVFGDYVIEESLRNRLRKSVGLAADQLPSIMPDFSHGNTYSYPLTGKVHNVDLLVGMSMAFRASLFDEISFSTYFEGYGLYEDADFSLRALKYGKNYLATDLQLEHHHASGGRPNAYKYGRMVMRNGWYVWRIKNEDPSLSARFKWNATAGLLILVRLTNVLTGPKRNDALRESMGRMVGWLSLIFNKPDHKK